MAIFRKVHVSFWSDPFIEALTPEQKFFYLYLLTNDRTKQCGIYEITVRQMCYDTGYNDDTIKKLINYFVSIKKIKYNSLTNEIAIKNWPKYNDSQSPQVKTCIQKEFKEIKDRLLIQYLYSMETPAKEEQEEEQEEDKQIIHQELIKEIIEHLNLKTGKTFKPNSKPTIQKVLARIKEGYVLGDFKKVIDIKAGQWKNDLKMQAYLRPETLFGAKFEGYFNELPVNGTKRPQSFAEANPQLNQW